MAADRLAALCRRVLREGSLDDRRRYVDVPEPTEQFDTLVLPDEIRSAWSLLLGVQAAGDLDAQRAPTTRRASHGVLCSAWSAGSLTLNCGWWLSIMTASVGKLTRYDGVIPSRKDVTWLFGRSR
jgi:hypothetical protein